MKVESVVMLPQARGTGESFTFRVGEGNSITIKAKSSQVIIKEEDENGETRYYSPASENE